MERAAVIETHVSVLFFLGDRVYKLRKPVRTPFLDFSTRELRLADCQRELELNRRLAPDVYLGLHAVVDESGTPLDHLVVMRRLPEERRLASMAAEPGFDTTHLVRVARQVAAFHERAARSADIDGAGAIEHLTMLWSSNCDEVTEFAGSLVAQPVLDSIRATALRYLAGRHPLFRQRVATGRIVDGHGDLLAQDIFCLDDGPRILDCVEFASRFRWGDVLYDTAFLAMDLEHLGRPDLARRFLTAYREFAAEDHPSSLEHWYIGYRALVRAKVACLRAASDKTAAAEAQAFLAQAQDHLAEATVRVVLVGGLPGTGKSTLAAGLADHLGWTLLSSDEVRQELAGISPGEHAYASPFQGIYEPGFTQGVYRELLRRAELALGMGESVLLDATWLDPGNRGAARAMAERTHSQLHELCCVLPLDQARTRVAGRAAAGTGASDATPEVLDRLASGARAPWEGSQPIDTSRSPREIIARAAALISPRSAAARAPTRP